MAMTDIHADPSRARPEALATALSNWWEPVQALVRSGSASGAGPFDPSRSWQEALRLGHGLLEVNVKYVEDIAGAVNTHLTGLARVLSDGFVSATDAFTAQVESASATLEAEADEAKRTARAAARRAERERHDAAAERYQDMTKVELADELAHRGLPKTGNVEDLRERLVASDLDQES